MKAINYIKSLHSQTMTTKKYNVSSSIKTISFSSPAPADLAAWWVNMRIHKYSINQFIDNELIYSCMTVDAIEEDFTVASHY